MRRHQKAMRLTCITYVNDSQKTLARAWSPGMSRRSQPALEMVTSLSRPPEEPSREAASASAVATSSSASARPNPSLAAPWQCLSERVRCKSRWSMVYTMHLDLPAAAGPPRSRRAVRPARAQSPPASSHLPGPGPPWHAMAVSLGAGYLQ